MNEDILEILNTSQDQSKIDLNTSNNQVVRNIEENVFLESSNKKLINFIVKNSKSTNSFENLNSNKRYDIVINSPSKLNKKTKTVTKHSTKISKNLNNIVPFCDSCNEIVNNIDETNNKTFYGKVGYDFELMEFYNLYEDYVIENSGIALSKALLVEDPENPTDIYPILMNLNNSHITKNGCKIDPFNVYEEITSNIITELNEKGLKLSISKSGSFDLRNRSIDIKDYLVKNNKSIEYYDDTSELVDIRTVFKKEEYYLGNAIISSRNENGEIIKIFDPTKKDLSIVTSKESRYLSNINSNIEPFVERKTGINRDTSFLKEKENRSFINSNEFLNLYKSNNYINNDIDDEKKYYSHGYKTDYSISHGIDSIVYRGLLE